MWWTRRAWEVEFYPSSVLCVLLFLKCSRCTWCHKSEVERGMQISRNSSRSDKPSGSSTGSRGPGNETSGDMFRTIGLNTDVLTYVPLVFPDYMIGVWYLRPWYVHLVRTPGTRHIIYPHTCSIATHPHTSVYIYICIYIYMHMHGYTTYSHKYTMQPRNWWPARNMVGDKLPKLFGEMPCAVRHPIAFSLEGEDAIHVNANLSKGKAC